jgi:hypothetical protein
LINNFNSLFELSAALNIGYASIPQLATAINNMFFNKIISSIDKIEHKFEPAENMIEAIERDDYTEEDKKAIKSKIKKEIEETTKIKTNINQALTSSNNKISNMMRPYFLLISIMSIGFMVVGGYMTKESLFPTKSILDIYIIALLLILFKIAFKYKSSWERNLLIGIGLFIVVLGCYFYESNALLLVESLKLSNKSIINIMLLTTIIPLLITIILYFFKSISIVAEYKPKVTKQHQDIEKILKEVEHVSLAPQSVEVLKKIAPSSR